eukprot:CAMPEP_0206497458 /NCGR_PEP_ID=MMETSP0324_2-20121206/50209_1 /ASSEMBLY_ACC=CAM_ASM_000836 /TAXON_ID=2866 /ORGANISM="Crypthecodinium cohnii, Strain Seligo" /LENGTH=52 /DNA_ID=CAMNT_0053983055 /DNA_START=104 /DNA_END=259 /DNA_ORIENTATION=+
MSPQSPMQVAWRALLVVEMLQKSAATSELPGQQGNGVMGLLDDTPVPAFTGA